MAGCRTHGTHESGVKPCCTWNMHHWPLRLYANTWLQSMAMLRLEHYTFRLLRLYTNTRQLSMAILCLEHTVQTVEAVHKHMTHSKLGTFPNLTVSWWDSPNSLVSCKLKKKKKKSQERQLMGIGFSTSTKDKFIIDQKIAFWTKSETTKLPWNMAQSSNSNAVC